jgi:hypothetical protein
MILLYNTKRCHHASRLLVQVTNITGNEEATVAAFDPFQLDLPNLQVQDKDLQYERGTTMPADYLSRLPSFQVNTGADAIAAFDPFQPNLKELQLQDIDLQAIFLFLKNGQWLPHLTKRQINSLSALFQNIFFHKNKLAWILLEDYKYLRTALWLPEFYHKEALCESHNQNFDGHNAAQKNYLKLTSSYLWPNVYSHVVQHTQTCF